MFAVGITGGIGSGKSTVCECFKAMGIPIYDSDGRAKTLMNTSPKLIKNLKISFGEDIFLKKELNKALLASIVFNDAKKLELLNSLVHPAVMDDFKMWLKAQTAPYAIMESAILVDSGFYKQMNFCIGIIAPLELRVKRVVERDNCTENQVLSRINMQLKDAAIFQFCNEIIYNGEDDNIMEQVQDLDEQIRYAAQLQLT